MPKFSSKYEKSLSLGDRLHGDHFTSSKGNKYILVVVDLPVKMDLVPLVPSSVIVEHFCNDQFTKVMLKYGVTHRLSTAYHPQTSGQVEVSNRGLKRILERTDVRIEALVLGDISLSITELSHPQLPFGNPDILSLSTSVYL
ncbi:reverse transcriptase domain-containing protein [Tanacetum coccineum]